MTGVHEADETLQKVAGVPKLKTPPPALPSQTATA
jgi:hypothetical protein